MAAKGPTFSPSYVGPGAYILEQDVSNPTVPQGLRIPAAIGQGSKTLLRSDVLTKGASNGTDGPLSKNIVIDVVSIIDQNNIVYLKGTDFLLVRPTPTTASISWSPLASLTGSTVISTLTPSVSAALDGQTLRLVVNGGTGDPSAQAVVFTTPADAAAVASQINAWDASLVGVASIDGGGHLVLSANSVVIEEGPANSILGFSTGDSAAVNEPATGITYQVNYLSDKTVAEYAPKIFSNMNSIIAYYGAMQATTVLSSGNISGSGSKTLSVSGTPWTVNAFVGNYVKITAGPGFGQVRVIVSNTANTLTLSQDWNDFNAPTSASTYVVTDVNNNSITLGAKTMFDAGATFVIGSQYADDLFDTNNIKKAIDNLESDVSGQRPEVLVLMRGIGSTETSIIAYLKAHAETMSNVVNNKFRIAVIGLASGNDDYLTFISVATGTKSRRVTLVNIADVNKDFGNGLVALDGSYIAAAYAGVYCANVDAGEPITRKSIAAVFDVDTFSDNFLTKEKDQMAANGVTVIERAGVDVRIRHAVTTDTSTAFTWDAKMTRSADYISNAVRQVLDDTLIGKRFTVSSTGDDVTLLAKTGLSFLFVSLTDSRQQIAVEITDLSVTKNPSVAQQLDIRFNVALTTDVLWAFALIGYSVG